MWFRSRAPRPAREPVALIADLLPIIPAEGATPTTRTHITRKTHQAHPPWPPGAGKGQGTYRSRSAVTTHCGSPFMSRSSHPQARPPKLWHSGSLDSLSTPLSPPLCSMLTAHFHVCISIPLMGMLGTPAPSAARCAERCIACRSQRGEQRSAPSASSIASLPRDCVARRGCMAFACDIARRSCSHVDVGTGTWHAIIHPSRLAGREVVVVPRATVSVK